MNALFTAAADLERFCTGHGWRSCVIGGLAVQRWGEPRQTRDVDVALLTGLGTETAFIDPLVTHYRPRIPDARQFAIDHRVVLVETATGIPLDISLAALPFEARVIERASVFPADSEPLITTCSAEDLMVLKAFAGRVQDWLDIEGIIVRQGLRFDRVLVAEELRPLLKLKDDVETEPKLQSLFAKHSDA